MSIFFNNFRNNNRTLSDKKWLYRLCFALINVFLGFFAAVLILYVLSSLLNINFNFYHLIGINLSWVLLSIWLSFKIWSSSALKDKITTREDVRKARYLLLIWMWSLVLAILLAAATKKVNSFLDSVISYLFWGNLIYLFFLFIYMTGIRRISFYDAITYPLQFLSGQERQRYIEQSIKKRERDMIAATSLAFLVNVIFEILPWDGFIVAMIPVIGGSIYYIQKLKEEFNFRSE